MTRLFVLGSIAIYLASSFMFLKGVLRRQSQAGSGAAATMLLAFILHSAALGLALWKQGAAMFSSGTDYFLVLSWLLPLCFFVFRRQLFFPIIGAFIAPAAALLAASSSCLPPAQAGAAASGRYPLALVLHVLPALLAQLALLLALAVSCAFLIVRRRLKRKAADTLAQRAPTLDFLERFNYRLVLGGFVLMTAAVISGTIWALTGDQAMLSRDAVQWLAVGAWLLLAFIIHSRVSLAWSARRRANLTLCLGAIYAAAVLIAAIAGDNSLHGAHYGKH